MERVQQTLPTHPSVPPKGRYTDDEVCRRIEHCPRLGSLRSINQALHELLHAEQSYTAQIAEIIRRDPTLTARLLKLVNSVFFGLSSRITNIEEAVFYLGLRQIRELGMATPIIEDFNDIHVGFRKVNWRQLWQHSIGTAILTRETLSVTGHTFEDDADYVVGLVHNVGKIVMAFAFPEEFDLLVNMPAESTQAVAANEAALIGWDHARIGAYYLEKHNLADSIIEAVRYHNNPEDSEHFAHVAASVQVSDFLVRSVGISGIELIPPVTLENWSELPGWKILFGDGNEEATLAIASLKHSLQLLPTIIKGMV